LAPGDARDLAPHVVPYFTAEDLRHRDRWGIVCRLVIDGHNGPPFSLDTLPAPPAIDGRAALLRAAARHRGLSRATRRALADTRQLAPHQAGAHRSGSVPAPIPPQPRSPGSSLGASPGVDPPGEPPTPPLQTSQANRPKPAS
ncbi:MAG: hypothetical protein L0Y54_13435, partial [Sporichthyaceae bacterium]|nr:hypothetical protein [Sporichthyaceae bacterium]